MSRQLTLFDWLVLKDRCEEFLLEWKRVTDGATSDSKSPIQKLLDDRDQVARAAAFVSMKPCACGGPCDMLVPAIPAENGVHYCCLTAFRRDLPMRVPSPGYITVESTWQVQLKDVNTADAAKAALAEMLLPYGIAEFDVAPDDPPNWTNVTVTFEHLIDRKTP